MNVSRSPRYSVRQRLTAAVALLTAAALVADRDPQHRATPLSA